MRSVLIGCSAALLALAGFACRADDLAFEVDAPAFRVMVPGIPAMKLDVHPMNASRPHLRLLGSEGPYTVSVLTPTADAGMDAIRCASATIRTLGQRPGVPPEDQVFRARINDSTYIALYAAPLAGAVHLHAHLLSAAGGTHCVEVHVSKVSTSREDVRPWFSGFGKASIEAR